MALKQCKECKGKVSSKAKTCPTCGAPVKPETSTAAGCLSLIVIAVVIAICSGVFTDKSSTSSSPVNPPNNPSPAPSPTPSAVADNPVTSVYVAGGGKVPIAATSEALDRWNKLALAKDWIGIAQLDQAGLVWAVDSGTTVRVIDRGVFSSEVRIESGDFFGKSGLVNSDFLKH